MKHHFNPTHFLRNTAFIFLIMLASNVSAANNSSRLSAITPGCAGPGETVAIEGRGFGAKNVSITVGGLSAEVLQATGHSAEFVVPAESQPGVTTVTAVNPGGQGGSIDFQVKAEEVCGNDVDDDCDGEIDEADACPAVSSSIVVDTSPFDFTLAPGEQGNISTGVSFTAPSSESFTIEVTQQLVALSGDASGISISPDVVGGFSSSTDKATVDNQEIIAYSDGVYEITTTAKIVQTGETASSVARVTVASNSQTLAVGAPGMDPDGLAPDTATPVVFTVQVQGADSNEPVNVMLDGDVQITLNDQGMDGDLVADDGSFSGTALVDTAGLSAGTCFSISAEATQGGDTAISEAAKLCVSSLPQTPKPSDMDNTITDPTTGEAVIADEILIVVKEGTPDDVIKQIAAMTTTAQASTELRITDSYSFAPVDDDGNGIFDALVAKIDVEVLTPGFYTVTGMLMKNGKTISDQPAFEHAQPTQVFIGDELGIHTATLVFSGEQIFRSGKNGPYELEVVAIGSDFDAKIVTTPAYDHTLFGERSARTESRLLMTGRIITRQSYSCV